MKIKQITVGMMGVCCYIVSCEKTGKTVIIDPGGDEERILKYVTKNNLEVEFIIATHGHPDHVCGNSRIKKATGAAIVMHQDDAHFFARPDIISYFSILGLSQSPFPDRLVTDSDKITFGEETLEVIHTPGHSPGGISLYCKPHCFTGDTLFVGGVGRADFPGGSIDLLIESIRKRLFTLPPETIVWPGHGYGGSQSTMGKEARSNPFLM